VHQQLIREPLATAEKAEQFDVIANLRGGGITGQAGALRLGIARALITNDPDDRPALKKAGFLTRTPGSRRARSTASRRPVRLRSTRSADCAVV
jgi:ribosomal protein S9